MKCGLFYLKYGWYLGVKSIEGFKNRYFVILIDEY